MSKPFFFVVIDNNLARVLMAMLSPTLYFFLYLLYSGAGAMRIVRRGLFSE